MIEGFSRFDPWPIEGPYTKPMTPEQRIEFAAQKIRAATESIRSWQTLRNIHEFKQWSDPLTGDFHFVLKRGGLVAADHIGDAAEVCDHHKEETGE